MNQSSGESSRNGHNFINNSNGPVPIVIQQGVGNGLDADNWNSNEEIGLNPIVTANRVNRRITPPSGLRSFGGPQNSADIERALQQMDLNGDNVFQQTRNNRQVETLRRSPHRVQFAFDVQQSNGWNDRYDDHNDQTRILAHRTYPRRGRSTARGFRKLRGEQSYQFNFPDAAESVRCSLFNETEMRRRYALITRILTNRDLSDACRREDYDSVRLERTVDDIVEFKRQHTRIELEIHVVQKLRSLANKDEVPKIFIIWGSCLVIITNSQRTASSAERIIRAVNTL